MDNKTTLVAWYALIYPAFNAANYNGYFRSLGGGPFSHPYPLSRRVIDRSQMPSAAASS